MKIEHGSCPLKKQNTNKIYRYRYFKDCCYNIPCCVTSESKIGTQVKGGRQMTRFLGNPVSIL